MLIYKCSEAFLVKLAVKHHIMLSEITFKVILFKKKKDLEKVPEMVEMQL